MAWTGSPLDRQLIRELIDQYCDAVTQRDPEAWAATWAEDCRWDVPHMDGLAAIEGKAAVLAAWKEGMAQFPFVQMNGFIGHLRIEGDTAYLRSYTSEVAVRVSGEEIRPRGQYDDVCVRQGDRWVFKSRKFTVLHGE